LSQPVDGDPTLRWTGPASETTMTTENSLPLCRRAPWNKGRLIGQKRPLKPKDIAAASLVARPKSAPASFDTE
jgi:hypothetical protein